MNTCYDYIYWDEVVLKNKSVEKSINTTIKKIAFKYKTTADAEERCSKEILYEPKSEIVYANNGIVSVFHSCYEYVEGALHGNRIFGSVNFDSNTGNQIKFYDLVNANKTKYVNELIIQKLQNRFQGESFDLEHYTKNLEDVDFKINNNGITILFKGDSYATTIVEVVFTYDEIENYIKDNSILKGFYNTK
ncbi:hypothetical protein Q0590_36505 [Rhodocytophaga aerolata]|uniref:DUF3298 domain-containing protein n=1 Tax=Rhodocytophaga aerolata TaxID=455078 RepID=A0ABT8RIA1_9BACT|nr:hypothetical protein [Rhodocytophaga aerolata]MDO1451829.1 hypothetical protein [Rhodocytophaga aerolata]